MSDGGGFSIPIFGDPNAAFTLSQALTQKAEEYVDRLADFATSFEPININASFPVIAAPPVPVEPASPTLVNVTWSVPQQPAAFSLLPPNFANLFPAPFQGVAPALNFGSLPQPSYGSIPPTPGIDLNFSYPVINDIVLPDPPILLGLDTVTFNPFDIPTFDGVAPQLTLAAPTPLNYVEAPTYVSDLLDDVTDSLESALTNGTDTGLDTATQTALWDAGREREYRQQTDALAEIDRMEALGYAFPPGVYIDARLKVQTETNYTIAGLSREILVKQAELRLENVMKSRELAISLESKWLDNYNEVQQRALENAKYQTEALVSIYNAGVQAYTARLEGFKATIQAYDAYIRGIEARISQIKAQVDYEATKAQINQTLVATYKAQIDAAETTLEIAKVQVEIIQTEANVEKLKVDVYGQQIQAFVATVNAYTAEVEGYKANAQAQEAITNVYRTQVEAYSATVTAAASQSNALVAGYDAQVKGYEAQLEGYKATLQAMVEQARAASEFNQAQVAEYTALVNATAQYNETLTKQWQAIISEQLQVTEVGVKTAEANAQIQISQRQVLEDAIKGAASVMSQLGAAALGAIHFGNTSNWNLGKSLNFSTSMSTTENTNYNETL